MNIGFIKIINLIKTQTFYDSVNATKYLFIMQEQAQGGKFLD